MPSLSRSRRAAVGPLLALASTLVGLTALELAFRLRVRFSSPPPFASAPLGQAQPGAHVRLGQIVRSSPDPRIIYELVPGLDVEFLGVPLRTNPSGFRGPAIALERTRPAVRVVGLGDSVMFGWGVREEETFLARAAALLSADTGGVAWEAVNTAVPGYNTVMEVETLAAKGLRFDPDLVVLNFVGNDLGLPNFVQERPELTALDRSFLLDFVRARLRGEAEPGTRLVGISRDERRAWGEAEGERVPPAYRALVGPQAWREAMGRLAALGRTHRFETVVVVHPVAPPFVRAAARELGFLLVETDAAVQGWARANGVEDVQRPPLTLTDADPHPSALGQQIIAKELAGRLRESGLSARLAARHL